MCLGVRGWGCAAAGAGAGREALARAPAQAAARILVRKKLRSLTRVDDTVATRRLVGRLARKGYPSGLAFAVVRDELAAAGRDEGDESPD